MLGQPMNRSMLFVQSVCIWLVLLQMSQGLIANPPSFEDYATIEARTDGVPVYSLGNLTYIYGVSPDYFPDAVIQTGNVRPKVKIKPKKSWEIESNGFGAYPAQPSVRTAKRDSQPFLPIHLIDGDPDTAWASYGGFAPDVREEWIRIDLPRESAVASVVLVCSQHFAMGNCDNVIYDTMTYKKGTLTDWMGIHRWGGRALPRRLKIEVSSDAWHWETVYETNDFQGNEKGETVVSFEPHEAKQIRVTAGEFPRILDKYIGYGFSLGEMEVRDPKGTNLALVSRGAGVSVSSTSYLMNHDRITQQTCFAPVLYDLGLKWIVLCSDEGLQTWHNVELERGRLEVDPAFDAMVTDLNRRGLKVILGVDVKANPVYQGRKLNWTEARYRQINNDYYDCPGWVFDYPEMWEPYLHYIKFMAEHFKGRVAYYGFAADVPHSANRDFYAEVMSVISRIDPDVEFIGSSEPEHYFPGSSVTGGRLRAAGPTIALHDNVCIADGSAEVIVAGGGVKDGLVLRFQDSQNYLFAGLNAKEGNVQIQERVNDLILSQSNDSLGFDLDSSVTLSVDFKGPDMVLTVTTEKNTKTIRHTVRQLKDQGAMGLQHQPNSDPVPVAAPGLTINSSYLGLFDNFIVRDTTGKVLAEDLFDEASERAGDWTMKEGRWLSEVPTDIHAVVPTMTTAGGPLYARIDAGGTIEGLPEFFSVAARHVKSLKQVGFKGLFNYWFMTWSRYPPGPAKAGDPEFIAAKDDTYGYTDFRYWCDSETKRAKFVAQSFVGCAALDVLALYCNPYFSSCNVGQSLFRVAEPGAVITPMQPDTGYYVLRTICTVMDSWQGAEFPVRFSGSTKSLQSFCFRRGPNERMIAAWIPGGAGDDIVEEKCDWIIPNFTAHKAIGIELFNGTEQELEIDHQAGETIFRSILVKDYPTIIRFEGD